VERGKVAGPRRWPLVVILQRITTQAVRAHRHTGTRGTGEPPDRRADFHSPARLNPARSGRHVAKSGRVCIGCRQLSSGASQAQVTSTSGRSGGRCCTADNQASYCSELFTGATSGDGDDEGSERAVGRVESGQIGPSRPQSSSALAGFICGLVPRGSAWRGGPRSTLAAINLPARRRGEGRRRRNQFDGVRARPAERLIQSADFENISPARPTRPDPRKGRLARAWRRQWRRVNCLFTSCAIGAPRALAENDFSAARLLSSSPLRLARLVAGRLLAGSCCCGPICVPH
jgi:hypothetical protein